MWKRPEQAVVMVYFHSTTGGILHRPCKDFHTSLPETREIDITPNRHISAGSDATGIKMARRDRRGIRILEWVKDEFVSVLPAIAYFVIAFNLLILNDKLILWEYGMRFTDFMRPAIGALVIAKVLVLVNLLPFINAFPNRPLIWNTIWKTLIYWIGCIGFQIIESMLEFGFEYKSLSAAYQHTMSGISSPRFVMVQMWLFVLLLIFVALQELVRALGPGKIRALFFGSRTTSDVRGNA